MKTLFIHCLFILVSISVASSSVALTLRSQAITVNGHTTQLLVPDSLRVEYVTSFPGLAPRFLNLGPDGEFLVGSRGGNIYRVAYPYNQPEQLVTLNGYFHSLVFHQGRLYGAETAGVWSAPYGGQSALLAPGDFSLETALPSQTGGHSSRTIIAGPDNNLYIGLGISGNCSDEYLDSSYPFERRRGGVFLFDGTDLIPFASGLRNPIGLAFHPTSNILYATNAGMDHLGYELPGEVLSPLGQGSFHGMPWYYYDNGAFFDAGCASSVAPRPANEATSPSVLFAARSTPEGIAFLHNTALGQSFEANAVVAIHGSWATRPGEGASSRREPKLKMVLFNGSTPTGTEDMVTGFQRSDGSRFARPCGVAVGTDGNIYFTSDGGDVTGLFRLVANGRSVPATGQSVSATIAILLNK